MNYKLVCIDMDGTLLNDRHEISKENEQAIIRVVEKGVKVILTTGRLFASARLYARTIGINTWVICSNGAYIRDMENDDVVFNSRLDAGQFNYICDVIDKYDLEVNFNTFDRVITNKMLLEDNTHVIANRTVPDELKVKFGVHENLREIFEIYKEGVHKAMLYTRGNFQLLARARRELMGFGGVEVISSQKNNIEIACKGVSKANGIKILARSLGVKREEIMCIGDNENDISMIEYAGLGVAMGNATEELKAVADCITDTNLNSGVGKALEKFIINCS